jgi:glycerate 2-kinase
MRPRCHGRTVLTEAMLYSLCVTAMRHQHARLSCERIVGSVIARVQPEAMVSPAWREISDLLEKSGPDKGGPVDLLAFGKASVGMAEAVIERMATRLDRGIVLAPASSERELRLRRQGRHAAAWSRVDCLFVDHPSPTSRNVDAARAVEGFVKRGAAKDDGRSLLALISGGGSAHLASPAGELTLEDVAQASSLLMRTGATITELNTVRKHMERLKGGRLARLACRTDGGYAHVVSLVISDVIGDDLAVVASGPFAPDPTTFHDAMHVLESRGISRADATGVWDHLEKGSRGVLGDDGESPKSGDSCFDRVTHRVLGNNEKAAHAAREAIGAMGVQVVATRLGVDGDARRRAQELVSAAMAIPPGKSPCAIVWGGETTVTVGEAIGIGGRNQEFALAAAERLAACGAGVPITVLSFSTDGVDGPTDAAGGFAMHETWDEIEAAGIDPRLALAGHDSHRALDAVHSLIRTGPTGTNVNDVMVAIVGRLDPAAGGGQ